MGNILLDDYKKDDPLQSFEKWLQQNPQLTGKQTLAENKLFLTSRFIYSAKQVLLKVYFKRDISQVSDILKSFEIISSLINQQKCTNLLPLTILNAKQVISKKDSNLIIATRQFLSMTLEDKLQRRPYLTIEQKKWLIFQMILAIETVHNHLKIFHGNIRTSNFLLTSYDYLMLTDFANYKPTYILEDTEQGLAEFRLFYPSSLEKCNLSPDKLQGRSESAMKISKPEYLFSLYKDSQTETRDSVRFSVLSNDKSENQSKSQLSSKNVTFFEHMNDLKAMDLFSLGLSILQVINDGKITFTYENLLSLKKSKFSLEEFIDNIFEPLKSNQNNDLNDIKEIVADLLLTKKDRNTSLIESYPKLMKDEIFVLLWHCLSSFSKISFQLADHRVYLFQSIIEFIEKQIKLSDHKFVMKRAKCLQNFAALKIFAQLIRKKLIFSTQIQPHTILGQILSSIQKKDGEGVVQSQEEIQLPQNNKRQSFFINESKKKRISKRLSFAGHARTSPSKKTLCPPQADEFLEKLIQEQTPYQLKFSKMNLQQRKKTKLQLYIQKVKSTQQIRQQLKQQKSLFYSGYQNVVKLIFSCIRNCQYVASKLLAIELINLIASQSSDKTLLHIILPLYIHLAQDSSDINVAKYAFNSLLDLCYMFIDPFDTEEDIAYYHVLLDFFVNTIKGSNIRMFMFARFQEIYNICEWLELCYLRVHVKFTEMALLAQSQHRLSVSSIQRPNPQKIDFYKLVDQLKVSYGTFSMRQIQQLMENIPIAILPEMFEFYISFLNTEKVMGLKCSLFIAENATKEFEMQRYIIDVFDNCMESGLCENGIALCYSIKYFTIRKNVSLDILHKVVAHVINPHRWVRDQALSYVRMCLTQFPPTKIFFLFRNVLDPPFPLTIENLSQSILLPQPLRQIDVNFKDRKFTNKISRKMGLTQKKFTQYLKSMKPSKDPSPFIKQLIQPWQQQTKRFRQPQSRTQIQTFTSSMRKTIERLYENNFFYYGFSLLVRYNPNQREQGLNNILDNLKKLSKFSLQTVVISQQQKEFFENMFATINLNFEKLLSKVSGELTPFKLKLSLCINLIAQQLLLLKQIRVKPTINLGVSTIRPAGNDRNWKPKGIQVSEIYENKEAISGLCKVGDYFFVSACHDGSMRVYDTRAIEMNLIAEAEAVYELKSQTQGEKLKITSLTCLQSTYTAILATSKGQLKGIQIQRMPNKLDSSRFIKQQNQLQLFKYNVSCGDVQKITCPKSPQFSQCVAYVTSESVLGVQDIRCKELNWKCSIGKERGYCLSLCGNDNYCLLVGTVDGYLVTYDIRFNIISSVMQLMKEGQSLPITNIIKHPTASRYTVTYPSLQYEFAQFNTLATNQIRLQPTRLYSSSLSQGYLASNNTSGMKEEQFSIPSIPYFENRTNQEVFKLCNNSLEKHLYYQELSNFDKGLKILDYVSQPLTLKQSKIRQIWANNCRHRYNLVLSLYNKKSLPFVQHFTNGILTNLNPTPESIIKPYSSQQSEPALRDLTFLTQRKASSESQRQSMLNSNQGGDIDREMTTRHNKIKISQFQEVENKEHLTNCVVVNGMVAVANRQGRIKLFR